MSWFNRYVIGTVSPRWALARERYSRGLKAYYEAGTPERLRKNRTGASANATNDRGATRIINSARHLEENLDIASGALDVLVANTIGAGIQVEPLVQTADGELAEEFNEQLLKLWDDWIYAPEVTGQFDYYTLQRLAGRSMFRDGEVFGQRLIGRIAGLQHGTTLPYSIEAFECDFVPFDYTDPGKRIRQGIELNTWGRPVKYHRYKSHPGDNLNSLISLRYDTDPLPAERVLHLKMVKRLHQLRGISLFAPVLNRFDDIKEIDENERVAARVAAAMAAYIKKGLPEDYTPVQTNPDGTKKLREMEFVPGLIFDDLQPGEEIGTIDTKRPNNALIPFRDSQLRSGAAGLMASYSSLSKNYNGTYSAQRQELVEQFQIYRTLSGNIVFRWCQPVWDGFIDAVIASGAVRTSGIDLSTVYDARHTTPPMPWIDPLKEIDAFVTAEEHGYEAKSSIIRKRGDNPRDVYRERKRDKQQRERLGLDDAPAQGREPLVPDPEDPESTTRRAAATFEFRRRRAT